MKVARWGNSLAVRLPRPLVEAMGLKEGDEIEISGERGGALRIERDQRREAALRRIDELASPAPSDFRFDRSEIYDSIRSDNRRDDDAA